MTKETVAGEIENGMAALGIEFGSTRIKAVLIDSQNNPVAQGGFTWENSLADGIWTYTGTGDRGTFTLTRSGDTGAWLEFTVDGADLKIAFSDFKQ